MAKGNILKEAIADAKAVREVALANAKAALEEAFTPKLQNMLNARLSEDLDETYYDEDEKNMEEMMYDEDEDMDEGMHFDEDENLDEEIDLEEILNELELEEGNEVSEKKKGPPRPFKKPKHGDGTTGTYTGSEMEEGKDKDEVEEAVGYPNHRADQVQKVYHSADDINRGLNENEEFDLDSLLKEINDLEEDTLEETPEETTEVAHTNPKGVARKGMRVPSRGVTTRRATIKPRKVNRMMENGCKDLKKELNEVKEALKVKTGELNEVNLLNSKLLYVNRIFKANNLDDSQKLRVVETLDKADSTKEAKLIYETIKDAFNVANAKKVSKKTKTRTIKEGLGMASKAAGTSTAPKKAIISETDNMVGRFQKLANIKINE